MGKTHSNYLGATGSWKDKKKPVVKKPLRRNSIELYNKRNRYLIEIGFCDYDEYLGSDLYKSIRAELIEREGRCCMLCGKTDWVIVHHLDYTRGTLSGKVFRHMKLVCPYCHRKQHELERKSGKKLRQIWQETINERKK